MKSAELGTPWAGFVDLRIGDFKYSVCVPGENQDAEEAGAALIQMVNTYNLATDTAAERKAINGPQSVEGEE